MVSRFVVLTADVVSNMPEEQRELITKQLDALGEASGVAQGLRAAITSISKLQSSPASDENVIILAMSDVAVSSDGAPRPPCYCGFLKYGFKSLYLHKKSGELVQCRPICLLDFYVDESVQRQGVGKRLFAHFLSLVSTTTSNTPHAPPAPQNIAYDRPSPKLYPFLKKHYGLVNHDLSPYGFAVFPGFTF